MKTKKLAKSLEEYNRLQSLIDDIERVLARLAKIHTREKDTLYLSGTFTLAGYTLNESDGLIESYIDVTLPRSLSELVREDIIDSLKVQLGIAKQQQNALEV